MALLTDNTTLSKFIFPSPCSRLRIPCDSLQSNRKRRRTQQATQPLAMFEFCNPEAESNMSLHKPRFEDTWFHLCRRFAASLFDITVGEAFVKYVVDLVARSPRHCCTFCRFWSRSHAQFYSNEVRARGQLLPRLFKRFWEYCKHPAPDFTLKTDTTMDPYALGLHNALRHPGMPIRAVQALRQELARSCFKTLHSANGQSLDTLHCLITGVAEKYLDTAANKKHW